MGTLVAARQGRALLDYAVAARALHDSPESGDAHLVLATDGGVLVAAVDGLGHGSEAAMAARTALAILAEHAGAPVTELLNHCHLAMQRTRGAAMTVAVVAEADGTMSWAGVGNVDGLLLRRRRSGGEGGDLTLNNLGGVVGYRMPRLRNSQACLAHGDLLVFATDGIASGFTSVITRVAATEEIAARILEGYGRANDDALVMVARWLGGRAAGDDAS